MRLRPSFCFWSRIPYLAPRKNRVKITKRRMVVKFAKFTILCIYLILREITFPDFSWPPNKQPRTNI